MGITKKIYVCATCQKEFDTAKEAIDCCSENLDTTAPADVTELAAVAKDSSVLITWKDAADKDIYGYLVSWKTAGAGRAAALEKDSLIVAKGQQGCIVTGLANGTEYTFTVKTMDTSGNKSKGVAKNATPKAVPEGETLKINFAVPEEKSNTSVTVTVIIETAAKDVKKVVYKKAGSLIASELLKDPGATEVVKDSTDSKKWTFVLEATDESANGMYTVAAIDYDGREEAAQIAISNFDFTAPKVASELAAELSTEKTSVTLTWKDPDDKDFDHVEICFVSNDGTSDSEKSEAVEVKKGVQNKVFDKIDSNMDYYRYFIITVDTLGNKSSEIIRKVYIAAVPNIPEGFVSVKGATITGSSYENNFKGVFIEGRIVTLSPFYISKYEVTQEEYEAVMQNQKVTVSGTEYTLNKNPSHCTEGSPNYGVNFGTEQGKRPVEGVTWYDAVYYCNARSLKEGLAPAYNITVTNVSSNSNITDATVTLVEGANGYRLPTEAEWEFAARGGDPGKEEWNYTFSGANTAVGQSYMSEPNAGMDSVGWYCYNNDTGITGSIDVTNDKSGKGTHQVGQKKTNALGLCDMSGNVWEWCYDWYEGLISAGSVTDPAGAASGTKRVMRGGCWYDIAKLSSVSYRSEHKPDNRFHDLGFRIVRNAN